MSQVDYDELLSSKFKTQSTQKCVGVALRAALRDFPPINQKGNVDVTRRLLLPGARLLIQSIVHWRFESEESSDALARTLKTIKPNEILLHEHSAHLAAQSTHTRSIDLAERTTEETNISFASAANSEEFLYAMKPGDWSSRRAYDKASDILSKHFFEDLNAPTS